MMKKMLTGSGIRNYCWARTRCPTLQIRFIIIIIIMMMMKKCGL